MQTWSLREAIARTFPQDRLLLLDLGGWNVEKFNSFWNYPYVAGVLHNYGGRVYMGGNLALYAKNAHELKQSPKGGNIQGIGLFPEAIEHNPVVYELSTEITTSHITFPTASRYDFSLLGAAPSWKGSAAYI